MTQMLNLNQNDLFAAYSMPGSADYHVIKQSDSLLKPFSSDESGFVIAPFRDDQTNFPRILIQSDFAGINADFRFELDEEISNEDISKADYLRQLTILKNSLAGSPNSKVILSRTKSLKLPDVEWDEVFRMLVSHHSRAFVFLFNIPGKGAWMGASPELLINSNGVKCQSVALAGTQQLNSSLDQTVWDLKDQTEHEIVSDFFVNRLKGLGVSPKMVGPYTARASNVQHLKTDFGYRYEGDIEKLLSQLHPSPALLGWPIDQAYKMIDKFETHSRAYYCGYLGPVDQRVKSIYINLRSMKCGSNSAILYAGGGILENSNPEQEWQETENKMTLLENAILNPNLV